MTNRIVKC